MPLISFSVRAVALAASVLLSTQAVAADADVVVGLTNIYSVA